MRLPDGPVNRHDTACIFGAICPSPGSSSAIIRDGAGWHQTGGELSLPGNIVLVPLPAYSPEISAAFETDAKAPNQ